ncbi:hypothetical protein M153_90800091 [Pseudoloma neurophilia]|uniref:Uncharacterized protein n=1 Tax=Pseudoloma neurophilia TaxID=146866 RepID=A0A0R0LVH2_9MICR|nr:hypothetical protein M153_90800091 [Pseudoloma neurophilia]
MIVGPYVPRTGIFKTDRQYEDDTFEANSTKTTDIIYEGDIATFPKQPFLKNICYQLYGKVGEEQWKNVNCRTINGPIVTTSNECKDVEWSFSYWYIVYGFLVLVLLLGTGLLIYKMVEKMCKRHNTKKPLTEIDDPECGNSPEIITDQNIETSSSIEKIGQIQPTISYKIDNSMPSYENIASHFTEIDFNDKCTSNHIYTKISKDQNSDSSFDD